MTTLRRRLTLVGEDGIAMVIAIVVMTIVLLVAAVAVAASQQARTVTTRDARGDRALQAAEAGAQGAIYRLNQLNLGNVNFSGGLTALSQAISCQAVLKLNLGVSLGIADAVFSTGQCGSDPAPSTGLPLYNEEIGGREKATAYVNVNGTSTANLPSLLGHVSLAPEVVSVGRDTNGTATTSDDVIRRIRVALRPIDPFSGIEATGDLTFGGSGLVSTTTLNGNARANGNVSFPGLLSVFTNTNISLAPLSVTGSLEYAGTASAGGVGINLTTSTQTSSPPVHRTAVTISPSKRDCPVSFATCGTNYIQGYDATTHAWSPTSNVTLPAGDYVFCKMTVPSGVTITTAASSSTPVRIYIDQPSSARCSGTGSGAGNLSFAGRISDVNVQPTAFQIYVADNGTGGNSTATFNFTSSLVGSALLPGFTFYAPDTDVTMTYVDFQGTVVGHNVTMTPAAICVLVCVRTGVITQDLNVNNLPLSPQLSTFYPQQYSECRPTDVTGLPTITTNC